MEYKYVTTLKDAPQAARAGAKILKEFSAEVSKSADARTLTFQCSSGSLDRHSDRVIQAGLDTTNFVKTGSPILYSHDYSALPLGRAVSLGMNAKGLTAEILFADHPFAQQVYELALGGFLRSVSIGFIPKEYELNGEGGYNYTSSELIEISVVSVPAQVDATRLRALAGRPGDADEITEADIRLLAAEAIKMIDASEARMFGTTPKYEDDDLTEADIKLLGTMAAKMIDESAARIARMGGPAPEPTSDDELDEADIKLLAETAKRMLEDFAYKNLGIVPEEK